MKEIFLRLEIEKVYNLFRKAGGDAVQRGDEPDGHDGQLLSQGQLVAQLGQAPLRVRRERHRGGAQGPCSTRKLNQAFFVLEEGRIIVGKDN